MIPADAAEPSAPDALDDAAFDVFLDELLAYGDAVDAQAARRQDRRLIVELVRRRHHNRRSPLRRLLAVLGALTPPPQPTERRSLRPHPPAPPRPLTSQPILRTGPPGLALGTPSGVPARA